VAKKPKRKKTELGRTLAKVRIDFDETGADMAKKLGISASQMFNIEVGLAQVGYEFIGKIKRVYEIDLTDIMKRGGFMSKITLDLDDLRAEDRDTVLEIWARQSTGEAPPKLVKPSVPEPKVMTSENTPVLTPDDKQPAPLPANARRHRPLPPPDDIVFLDEDSVDDLDGIEEIDVL